MVYLDISTLTFMDGGFMITRCDDDKGRFRGGNMKSGLLLLAQRCYLALAYFTNGAYAWWRTMGEGASIAFTEHIAKD